MVKYVLAAFLAFVLFGSIASAQEVAIPPTPTRFVTDTAHYFKSDTVGQIDAQLHAYEKKTGHQILVYTAPSTGSTSLEDWCEAAFHKWKVGRKGIDDGLILFVFPTDRNVRIQVGYGLEEKVPDAVAARIIRNDITPKFKAGDPDSGVAAGVARILDAIDGKPGAYDAANSAASADSSDASNPSCGDPDTVVFVSVFWLIALLPFVGGIFSALTYFKSKAGKHVSGANHEK